jgi:hypothetical protein
MPARQLGGALVLRLAGREEPGPVEMVAHRSLVIGPARWPSPYPPDRPPERIEGLRVVHVGHASVLIQGYG